MQELMDDTILFQVAKMWLAPILVAFLVILFLYLDAKKPKNFPPGIYCPYIMS
jgi:hypothetical protein